jgi:hypothetical protein
MEAEIYVIGWAADDPFVKVGMSVNQRWRAFVKRGGQPALILRVPADDVAKFERLCHAVMGFEANPRFPRPGDAAKYLGGSGAGFSECYRTTPEHAVHVVSELADRYLYSCSEVRV